MESKPMTGIDVLDIAQRTKNILNYYGFNTIGDLHKCNRWKTNLWADSTSYYLGLFLDDVSEIKEALSKISKETVND